MGNSRSVWFAALFGALLAMCGAVRSAAAQAAPDPLDVQCPEAFKGPGCRNYLAINPVPEALCTTLCSASGSTLGPDKKCPIVPADTSASPPTPAKDKVSPNGCIVSDKVWWTSGGAGPVCKDTDKDGVPDKKIGSCSNDPKLAQYVKAHPAFDHDNCVAVPNGPAQAGIGPVGDQTDTDGDDVGDACDYAKESEVKEALARMNAALAAIGATDDERNKVLADVKLAFDNGGLVGRNELTEKLGQTNKAVICLQSGRLPVFNADKTVDCQDDPWRTAKDATDAQQDAAIHAVERRTATVAIVGLAEGFGKTYGMAGGEFDMVARPSTGTEARLGLAVGAPISVDHGWVAMQVAAGADWFMYEGQTCRAGVGVEGILGAAYDSSFASQATSIGARMRIPFQCDGSVVLAPSIGVAYVDTPHEAGATLAYGLVIGYQR